MTQKYYLLEGSKVQEMPYFLYEVSIYKIFPNRFCQMDSQFYKSDKLLNTKDTFIKRNGYILAKYIDLLGVTKQFIKENNLYEETI